MHLYNRIALGKTYKVSGHRRLLSFKKVRFKLSRLRRRLWFMTISKPAEIIQFTNIEVPIPNVSLAFYINVKYAIYYTINGKPYHAKTNFVFLDNDENGAEVKLVVYGFKEPQEQILNLNYAQINLSKQALKSSLALENLKLLNTKSSLNLMIKNTSSKVILDTPKNKIKSKQIGLHPPKPSINRRQVNLDLNENLFYETLNQTYYEYNSKTKQEA